MARLFFDEQLSDRLCDLLSDTYPGSLHIRRLGHGRAADNDVWALARKHNCILVSKDEDFYRMSLSKGAPPKLIWVRQGNGTTRDLAELLRRVSDDIRAFAQHPDATILEIGS